MNNVYSHNYNGKLTLLSNHLLDVANLCKDLALEPYKDIAYVIGQLHDIGKSTKAFQEYILNNGPKTEHAAYGTLYCLNKNLIIPAIIIHGHHTYIHNPNTLNNIIKAKKININDIDKSLVRNYIKYPIIKLKDAKQYFLLIKYLYSLLIDSDYSSVAQVYNGYDVSVNKIKDIDNIINSLNNYINSLPTTPMTPVIKSIRETIMKQDKYHNGIYSLVLPTGHGKTLLSLEWVLNFLKHNPDYERIIYVAPYNSIIDQTLKIYNDIFGSENVLAHYSTYIPNENEKDYYIKTETWNVPVILTSMVQFIGTMLSNTPAKLRKYHRMAKSVIIIDEVHSLPTHLLDAIKILLTEQSNYNTTILVMSATMPDLNINISNIYTLEAKHKYNIHLVNNLNKIDITELPEINDNTLVIVNTKDKALKLYNYYKNKYSDYCVYYLTTNLYSKHRLKRIEEIINKLKENKEKIIVVSTSLIEAGVDIDFPVVMRELNNLNSIIQSGGRCNRRGLLGKGNLYVFKLMVGSTSDEDLNKNNDNETYAEYLAKEYLKQNKISMSDICKYNNDLFKNFLNTDKCKLVDKIESLRFEEIDKIRVIDNDDALSVLILTDESKDIINKQQLTLNDIRQLSQYMASINHYLIKDKENEYITYIHNIPVWIREYNDEIGIVI